MTLRPTDMLEIQSAIDAYERKFPRQPTPTPEVALAWRLGKRAYAKRLAAERRAQEAEETPIPSQQQTGVPRKRARRRESASLAWLIGQVRLRWLLWRDALESSEAFEDSAPLVQSVLRVGFWGVAAVLIVSVFLLGAVVGGFK
jgi:hypothetical protein